MRRIAGWAMIGLIVAAIAMILGDWATWRMRGSSMGTAQISRFQVAPLKGNKEEYYFDGSVEVDCSRSIFPQAGSGACWWLARHPVGYYR